MTDPIDWMARANAKAKGKRPQFFDEPEDERIFSILMALVGEVSVLRQRLDTVERLLEERGALDRADIEAYEPTREEGMERGEMIREYVFRVMRGPMQQLEELESAEPPVEEVSRELKDL